MPNVDSSGGIQGRVGRSMDCSQLMEIRRKYAGVHQVYTEINTVGGTGIPRFNQDKFNREPLTNGAVDFYFTRGLYPLFGRVGPSK
jgi:hypothetical protein